MSSSSCTYRYGFISDLITQTVIIIRTQCFHGGSFPRMHRLSTASCGSPCIQSVYMQYADIYMKKTVHYVIYNYIHRPIHIYYMHIYIDRYVCIYIIIYTYVNIQYVVCIYIYMYIYIYI